MTKAISVSHPQWGAEQHLREFSAPVAWLEQIRPTVFQETTNPNFQLGALHSIEWKSALQFVHHVLAIVRAVTGLAESNFSVTPFLRFEDGRKIAKAGVGIFLGNGSEFDEHCIPDLDTALASFCSGIVSSHDVDGQGDLFHSLKNEKIESVVATAVCDFLAIFGGKRVGETRLLKTRNSEMLIAGVYRSRKDSPLPDPELWTTFGEIDGLRGSLRTAYVVVNERKTIAFNFDELRFLGPLKTRILDGSIYEFSLETQWISHEKQINNLVSFHIYDSENPILP